MADDMISSKNYRNKYKDIGWGYRHQQCLILGVTYVICFSMKTCIGVVLVAMTKNKRSNMSEFDGKNATMEYKPEGILNTLMLVPPYPTFDWDKKVQETVIASFYWGYMILQIPAGQLAHRFGVKYLLTGALTVSFVMSMILPLASYYGNWYCTIVCRVAQGLSQACLCPGIHTFLGKWTHLHERGRMTTFIYGAQALGVVLGLSLTGFISASFMGWPGVFRCYGIVSGIMALILWFYLHDTPAKHPKISLIERKFIEDDVGTKDKKMCLPVPWSKIFRHRGILCSILAQSATLWGNLILYSELPLYMDKIIKVNIKANGLLSALPCLVMWCMGLVFSWFIDWLIVKNIFSVSNTRKVAVLLGYIPCGVGLIVLAYAPPNIYIVETILITVCAFKIAAYNGFLVNHVDISPNFAGTTMSLSNFLANTGPAISPLVIGYILTDMEDKYQWRQVFWLTACVYLFSCLIYVTFGTSERADWNEPPMNVKEQDVEESVPIINKSEQ